MKLNTHGMKLTGIRKTAGSTRDLTGRYGNWHTQIMYDPEAGEVWGTDIYGCNSWVEYHDHSYIRVCNTYGPMTMQEIADEILRAMTYREEALR